MTRRPPIYVNGRFLAQPLTGVQRYSRELLGALNTLAENGEIDLSAQPLVCLAPPDSGPGPAWKHIPLIRAGRFTSNLWEQVDLPLAARGGLLFSPGNIGAYFHPHQVATLHDASVFAYPQAYTLLFRLKYQVMLRRLGRIARQIITVSEFSRGELARYCHIPLEKITVIPHGHEHLQAIRPDPSILARLEIGPKPYLLAVGSDSPHKNMGALIEAMRGLRGENIELIVAGGSFSRVFAGGHLDLPSNVRRAGYVTDGELRALYESARGFVLPSLYEGFGLPLLEAMAFGCPVICSDRASLPEVAGDAALYFDPSRPEQIRAQIQALLHNPAETEERSRRGFARLAGFTWTAAARRVWDILAGK